MGRGEGAKDTKKAKGRKGAPGMGKASRARIRCAGAKVREEGAKGEKKAQRAKCRRKVQNKGGMGRMQAQQAGIRQKGRKKKEKLGNCHT